MLTPFPENQQYFLEQIKKNEVSPRDFYSIIYPERDIHSLDCGITWRVEPVYGEQNFKDSKGFTLDHVLNKLTNVDYALHHVLAYGQGTTSRTIKNCHILHYESDAKLDVISLEEKYYHYKKLGLPIPTIRVFTGSKSIHDYWILRNTVDVVRLAEIQIQIMRHGGEELDADNWHSWNTEKQFAIKTLRSPGFRHSTTGMRSFAFDYSGEYYDVEQFESIYPVENRIGDWKWDKERRFDEVEQKEVTITLNTGQWQPYKSLEEKIAEKAERAKQAEEARKKAAETRKKYVASGQLPTSKSSWSLLDLANPAFRDEYNSYTDTQGANNDNTTRIIYELIGLEQWAERNGISVYDNAYTLWIDCVGTFYSDSEIRSKYNSAASAQRSTRNSIFLDNNIDYYLGYSNRLKFDPSYSRNNKASKHSTKKSYGNKQETNDVAQNIDFRKSFSKTHETYDLQTILSGFSAKTAKKLNKGNDNAKLWVSSWVNEEVKDKDFDYSSDVFFFGNPTVLRANLLINNEIKISCSEDTKDKHGIFINANSLNDARKLTFLQEFLQSSSKDGFKINLIIDENEKNINLIEILRAAKLGFYALVENCDKVRQGAVYYTETLKQKLQNVDKTIDKRYLGDFQELINNTSARAIFLKSDTGTGKSETISQYINQNPNIKILTIYCLEKLTISIAKRLNLTNYKDTDRYGVYVQSSNTKALEDPNSNGLASTIHSLKEGQGYVSFDPTPWENYDGEVILFLDEIESTLETLANSSTIPNKKEIYLALQETIKAFLRNPKGRIVCADANLSQSSVDFIKESVPGVQTYIVENKYKFQGNRKAIIFNSKEELLYDLYLNKNKQNFIASDSRHIHGENSYCSTRAIEHFLGENNSIRVDAETAHTVDDKNYKTILNLEDLDKARLIKKPLLISPAAAIGVSISNTNFDAVYGMFKGVISGETIHQMLERDRSDAVRKIYIANHRLGVGNYELEEETLIKEEDRKINLNTSALTQTFGTDLIAEKAIKNIANEDAPLKKWRHRKKILLAWEGKHLQLNVISQMYKRGYEISYAESPTNTEDMTNQIEDLKIFCEETWNNDKKRIAEADKQVKQMIDTDQLSKLKTLEQQQDKTSSQHDLCQAFKIRQWIKFHNFELNEEDIELYTHKKQEIELGFHVWANLQGHSNTAYAASIILDAKKFLGTKRLKHEIRSCAAKRQLVIDVLNLPKIIEELQKLGKYTKRTPLVQEFHKLLCQNADEIKSVLGMKVYSDPDYAMKNLGNMLKLCCYNHECIGQKTDKKNGTREREYQICQPPANIIRIWQMWVKFYEENPLTGEQLNEMLKQLLEQAYPGIAEINHPDAALMFLSC